MSLFNYKQLYFSLGKSRKRKRSIKAGISGKLKVVPVHAMRAYVGVEVPLNSFIA
jgi:hypothetical protein